MKEFVRFDGAGDKTPVSEDIRFELRRLNGLLDKLQNLISPANAVLRPSDGTLLEFKRTRCHINSQEDLKPKGS